MKKQQAILIASAILAAFAVFGTSLVTLTQAFTKDRIESNEREALLHSLHALVPSESIDNDIITDMITVNAKELLGSDETTVYRGRKLEQPVAVVLNTIVPNGYSGPIKLLVAVRYDGTLGGVRVISHKETPGLGDKVEASRSDWIYGFEGKSLLNPPMEKWGVKRDGGVFDQFTGATVTPRAIVKAVKQTLLYVRDNTEALYDRSPTIEQAGSKNG
jgi:electron transport complex protein RnfG